MTDDRYGERTYRSVAAELGRVRNGRSGGLLPVRFRTLPQSGHSLVVRQFRLGWNAAAARVRDAFNQIGSCPHQTDTGLVASEHG